MKRSSLICASCCSLLLSPQLRTQPADPPPIEDCRTAGTTVEPPRTAPGKVPGEARESVVQLALLLDTSGSMSGLIAQAKGQLWKIVNSFIQAKQNGRTPEVQVALFEYGNSSLKQETGWIRQILPLTNDLDKVSEELFRLTTNGGEEYCGWVIREAVEHLAWSKSGDVYKAIFIAGNEPFTQGPVDYAAVCKQAIGRGIIVNTIHCGSDGEGRNTRWQDGALLAEGRYLVIDHNQAVVHFEAPQDKEIAELGAALNRTYIAFGTAGLDGAQRQAAQDANSSTLAGQGSLLNRAVFKASSQYCNDSWDLVDACKNGKVNLSEVKRDQLPAELRDLDPAGLAAHVEKQRLEREKLQKEIGRLNAERERYVATQQTKASATNTLDNAMITAIREQAAKRNYQFE